MTRKMNVELLREIAKKLKRYRPGKKLGWRMADFYIEAGDTHYFGDDALEEHGCQTAACALGTAIVKGWIPHAELTRETPNNPLSRGNVWRLKGRRTSIYDLGVRALGLTETQFDYLFMPDYYDQKAEEITPKDVAERIIDLVNGEASVSNWYEDLYAPGQQKQLQKAAKKAK